MASKVPGITVREGSSNVFRDLGHPDPEGMSAKATLAGRIITILEDRGLTQKAAAEILGIDQPKVSALYRGRLDPFSLERLVRFLVALGHDVRIEVAPKARRAGGRLVVDAAA